MIEEGKLTKYYSMIANQLNKIIPVEWTKIIMHGEKMGSLSGASFYFYTKEENRLYYSGNIPEDFSVSRALFKQLLRELRSSIRDLWKEFKDAGEECWYTITFTLEEDWKFKVKFGYEFDEQVGDFEREIIWAYNEVGVIPKDDYGKKVLKDYLESQTKEKE